MNVKKTHFIYLFYFVMITFIVTVVSFSRFDTVSEEYSNVSVAKPVLYYVPQNATLNGTPLTELTNGLNLTDVGAGDKLIYRFDIENYEGLNVNQVLLKYKIDVVFDPSTTNLPLTYTLQPEEAYSSAGGDWIYMGFGEKTVHRYTLTVTWDKADDDPAYINQEQNIQIIIKSEQAEN